MMQLWIIQALIVDGFAVTVTSVGGNLIGGRDFDGFREMNLVFLKLSLMVGFLFAAIYYFGSSFLWSFFTKDEFVLASLGEIWWIVVLMQPINAIIFLLDGTFMATKSFLFLRNVLMKSFAFGFFPFLVLGFLRSL